MPVTPFQDGWGVPAACREDFCQVQWKMLSEKVLKNLSDDASLTIFLITEISCV